jgi:hypothetical protein
MPECGEKYRHKIRTAAGATPGSTAEMCPTAVGGLAFCDMTDWEGWRQAMEALQGEVVRKASDLRTKAKARGRMNVFEEVAGLYVGPAQNAVAAAFAEEPSGLDRLPGEPAIVSGISKIIEAMNLLVCALEMVDQGYSTLELPVPGTPGAIGGDIAKKKPVDWETWAKRAGIAAGVGLIGYAAAKYFILKRMGGAYPDYSPYKSGGFR